MSDADLYLAPGYLLSELRFLAGLTVRDLAATSGVAASTISSIETGKRRPSRKTLLAITTSLGLGIRTVNRFLESWGYADVKVNFEEPNKVMEALEASYQAHSRGKPIAQLTDVLMEAYDEWLD